MADDAIRIAAEVRSGHRRAVDVTRDALDRIERLDDRIRAFREVLGDDALAAAAAVDRTIEAGDDPGPLAGVPIAVKDNIATETGTTTCCSRLLEGYRSPFTATAVTRLQQAGAVVVGRTRCDEFAMGSSNEHCPDGPTHNPWDTSRVPGGSSGGSAAAVASRMCPIALGSETGGSIRQPAALCGIVGVKPSYGRVSRFGLVAFGSSLDQIGPFATTVADTALATRIMAGVDPADSTSAPVEVPDYLARLDEPVEGLKIGVPRQFHAEQNHPAVESAIETAVERFRGVGAEILDIDLPLSSHGIATYYVVAPAEAASNLARFDGIRYGRRATGVGSDLEAIYARSRVEGFGPEVQRRIMLGTFVLSSGYAQKYYQRALKTRRLIKQELDAAFEQCHALLGPTTPNPAFRIGAVRDPLAMYLNDLYTTNANIAGICGISVPGGFAVENGSQLPIGVQIQCRAFDETTLFKIARQLEQAAPVGHTLPPLS